jgi:DNA-binding MarR family transcriptional regulator
MKKQPKLKFGSLKGRAKQIVAQLTKTIAFQNRECCSIEDFADEFKTTPGRLKKTLQQLEEAGLIKVTGDTYQQIEPTKKLLQEQDKH